MKSYLNDAFFSRLEALAFNLRRDLGGYFGGKHLVNTYGQTVEFADYREYMLGDDIRRIDWNLYSRFEKYFIKLFTDERQMQVQIYIDCSGSMGKVNPKKGAYAIGVAAAMGYLAIHNMDKVSYHLIRGDKAENPFGTIVGKTAFFRAMKTLDQTEFDGDVSISKAIIGNPNIGTGDGLTIVISDFFSDEDWKKGVDYLVYKKKQILLMQVFSPDELDPTYTDRINLIDAEATDLADSRNMKLRINKSMQQAFREAVIAFYDDIGNFCKKRGAAFMALDCEKPIERQLFSELLKRGTVS